jgi:hypothetical protein
MATDQIALDEGLNGCDVRAALASAISPRFSTLFQPQNNVDKTKLEKSNMKCGAYA